MCLTFVFFNLLRLQTFIGMHIQKIKYHIFSWPYFKAFLGNNHHILHFETTIFIVCRSHLPLLGHPSSIKCKKSIIYLTSFVKYYFLRIIFLLTQSCKSDMYIFIKYQHLQNHRLPASKVVSYIKQYTDIIGMSDQRQNLY